MLFQFAPIIPVYGLVAVLMLILAVHTWSLRPALGTTAWSLTMLFCAIHAIGSCLEIAFVNPVLKLAMNRVIYIGATGIVFFWGIFAIQYSNQGHRLNRVTVSLLAFVPLLVLCLALFAEQHQLLYQAYEFDEVNGLIMGRVVAYGPMFWVWLAYSVLMFASSWLLLLRSAIRSHAIFRAQSLMVVLASAAPFLTYLIQLAGLNPLAPYDPSSVILAIAGVLVVLAMPRTRFMDIVPVAYDLIFKNVKSGIVLIDLKGRVAGMNRAAEEILGCGEKDVLGTLAVDVFPKQWHIIEKFGDVQDAKTEISMTENESAYELQITPVHSHRAKLSGRLIMLYDITERKKIEKQTLELTMERERVRLLQQFVSHISHDLRTPLTSMKLNHHILRKELAGQPSPRLDSLEKQTNRLIGMVESMLTVLRLEEEAVDNLTKVDVNEIIGDIIEQNLKLANEGETHVRTNLTKDLPRVLANKDEIFQALSNVLLNAIHHTARDGEIVLSTLHDENCVVVKINDTGTGIAPEHLPHIFEHFYRVDAARGSANGGSGLGLTITKTIVERHAGTISVQSRVGEGTEFTIRLPTASTP